MKNILLLSTDDNIVSSFKDYFKDNSFFNLITTYSKEKDFSNYDLLILDYITNYKDGYDILKEINNDIKIIIITNYLSIEIANILSLFKVSYIFIKPISLVYLNEKLNLLFDNYDIKDTFRYYINKVLKELGINDKLYGTRYIFDILELVLCENKSINIKLYEILSKKYNKKISSIEKNIRYAIKICIKRGNPTIIDKYFGYCYDYDKVSITSLEFINCIVQEIKYKINRTD